jgi:internalin A
MENSKLGLVAEYIAPELLPDRSVLASQIDSQWEYPGEIVRIVCEYAYDDPSLIRSIIAEIGSRAKESAVYWRYGVCGYDAQSSSHFLIAHESESTFASRIILQCKGSGSRMLARELSRLVDSINARHGMRDARWSGDTLEPEFRSVDTQLSIRDSVTVSVERMSPCHSEGVFQFGGAPSKSAKEHFVSFAWGDDSFDGKQRTQAIEELCQKAKVAGIEITRDSTDIQPGDSISRFMDRLGESQRVFVILSDKYLKSEFCMYELWSIWRNCKHDPKKFLSHIRVFRLPCVQISKTSERLEYGGYWIKEKEKIDRLIETYSLSILGESDLKKYKCMADFAAQT